MMMTCRTVTWESLLNCFDRIGSDPKEFYMTAFRPEWLEARLGKNAPTIPPEWYTSGYADRIEIERYAQIIVGKLYAMGITVIGAPNLPPGVKDEEGRSAVELSDVPILVDASLGRIQT